MKKVLSIIMITAIGLSSASSCKKKNSSSSCTCTERGTQNQDTVVSFSVVDTPFTKLSDECSASDALLKLDSARYGCHM